jgi:3'-5' exonuclease/DNA polymerase family A
VAKKSTLLDFKLDLFAPPDPDLNPEVVLVTDPRWNDCLKEFSKCRIFATDLETYATEEDFSEGAKNSLKGALDPDKGEIRLISVALPSGLCMVADLGGLKDDRDAIYPLFEKFIIILGKQLKDRRVTVIGQNLPGFEVRWFLAKFGFKVRNIFDTMLASQVIWAGLAPGLAKGRGKYSPHALDSIAERLGIEGIEKSQGTQKSDWGEPVNNMQLNYSAKDSTVLMEMKPLLEELIREHKLQKPMESEFLCGPVFGEMMHYGMPVCKSTFQSVYESYRRLRAEVLIPFTAAFPDINPGSPKQLLRALNDRYHKSFTEKEVKFNAESSYDYFVQEFLVAEQNDTVLVADTHGYDKLEATNDKSLVELAKNEKPVKALLLWRSLSTQVAYLDNVKKNWHWDEKYQSYMARSRYQQLARTGMGRSSCFPGETLVSMADGSFKEICRVRVGELVKTAKGDYPVTRSLYNGQRKVISVVLESGRVVRSTSDHKFLSGIKQDWVELRHMKVGNSVYVDRFDGIYPEKISSVYKYNRLEHVYDLEIAEVHEYLANGIVVHNCSNFNAQNPSNLKPEWKALGLPNIRSVFKAPKGYRLVISDLASAHAQIARQVSQDKILLQAFERNEDIHSHTGVSLAKMQGLNWDYSHFFAAKEDKSHPDHQLAKALRIAAKPTFYGSQNLQGAVTLQATAATSDPPVYMTLGEAKDAKKAWTEKYSGLAQYQKDTVAKANRYDQEIYLAGYKVGTVTGRYSESRGVCGRRLYLEKYPPINGDLDFSDRRWRDPSNYRNWEVKATDCVSTVWMATEATAMKLAGGWFQEWLDKNPEIDCEVVRMAHDEWNVLVREDQALAAATKLRECMDKGMLEFVNYGNEDKVEKSICKDLSEK